MKARKKRKRISAMLLALTMVFTLVGYTPVAAENIQTDGNSEGIPCGHTTHDDLCGYVEAVGGAECSHEHDGGCYSQVTDCQHTHTDECYGEAIDATSSNAAEPENCTHVCTEDSGCITEELDCPHTHGEECGYEAADDGQPCKHEQGEHDETCGYQAAAPRNDQKGSNKLQRTLQKTNNQSDTRTLLTNAVCVVPSETANTQDAVTNWIKGTWLPEISTLDDTLGGEYDIDIANLQIGVSMDGTAFTAATNGTVEKPEGTAGQFKFMVVVPGTDGVGEPRLTVEKTCTITPKAYTQPEIPQINVKSTVLSAATVGESYSFSLDSLLADGLSAALVSWTLPTTTVLPEGLTFTAGEGTISGTPTTAGTYRLSGIKAKAVRDVYQANEFTFTLIVNEAVQYPTPIISASGETVELNNGVVHVDNGKSVQLEANLSQNAPAYRLQWQAKQEGASAFVNLADATAKRLVIDSADYPNDTQFRCVATYPGIEVRESAPVTIRHRITATASVTGTVRTENGTPLYGRDIEIIDENNNVIGSDQIGENGEYSISDVPDGNYFFNISGVERMQNGSISIAEGNVTGNTNHAISSGNIEGATSTDVPRPGGGNATIEFVSTGDSSSANTGLLVEGYTPTDNDWIFGAGQFSTGTVIADPNKVTVPLENITIYDNAYNLNGENYWIGDIVEINNEKYIVHSYNDYGNNDRIYWVNLSTGIRFSYGIGDSLPGASSANLIITEENKQVSINGAEYHARYAVDDGTGEKLYYLYVLDDTETMVAAGSYVKRNDGKIFATFNSGYAPTDLLPEQSDEQKTIVTPNGDMFNTTTAFSSNITITKNGTPQSGVKGAISISGLKNMGKSVSCHLSNGTYILGTNDADSDTYIWITEDQSPFMIFTFTEINTEIPVKTIPTDSGDGSGDSSSSSDGGSFSSDDSTYNPDNLWGTWIRTDTGIWKFRLTSGAYAKSRWGLVDGLWYYFDSKGKMLTGWQFLNNRWYYLCTEETSKLAAGRKEGAMLTGWYYDPMYQGWFHLDASGAMLTGWKEIGDRWYYFYENGVMAADTEVDGYKLGPDGAWIV